ncbi:hypothetical protein L7F22_034742 [Adiantum nelumboides]|nr:hypothetical protein [Adiantum nelumboides]
MDHHSHREIIDEVYGYITIYNDGTIERPPFPGGYLPASSSFVNGIATKDVIINTQSGMWARLFLPECVASSQRRAPVVLHFHGGGLCAGSPAAASFHKFCSRMAIKSESVWVSIDYRLAPEYRLPAAYDDGLTAFMWLCSQSELQALQANSKTDLSTTGKGSHSVSDQSVGCSYTQNESRKALGSSREHGTAAHAMSGHVNQSHIIAADNKANHHNPSFGRDTNGHVGVVVHRDCEDNKQASLEEWFSSYADFSKCFLAGESSGGAIVHYLTSRLSQIVYSGIQIKGLILIHSAFLVKGLYDESLNPRFERHPDTYRWLCLPVGAPGDHPLVNPLHAEAPSFKDINFPPTIVFVADQDRFYGPSLLYVQVMKQHGHVAELDITKDEGHCFYLYRPKSKKSELFYEHLVAFMHRQCNPQHSRSLL